MIFIAKESARSSLLPLFFSSPFHFSENKAFESLGRNLQQVKITFPWKFLESSFNGKYSARSFLEKLYRLKNIGANRRHDQPGNFSRVSNEFWWRKAVRNWSEMVTNILASERHERVKESSSYYFQILNIQREKRDF